MSKYTTEVRWICENKSGFSETELQSKTVDEIITASLSKIFNFEYPIYDATHKEELERKILKHYYTREIGLETFGLWQLKLNDKLNLIMPYYNKLYEYQEQIARKGLNNIDITTTQLRTDALKRTDNFTRTDTLSQIEEHLRTDALKQTEEHLRTDALKRTDNFLRTDDLLQSDNFTHTDSTQIDRQQSTNDTITFTDHTEDAYSDTPQGTLTGVQTDSYLTDFRRLSKSDRTADIKTETGSDVTMGTKTDYGTSANSGTQANTGTVDNTGTQKNDSTIDNTGTQKNDITIDNTDIETNVGTVDNTGTQEFLSTEKGYHGSEIYEKMLSQLADVIINIDKMIVNELADLFFNLW